MSTCTVKQEFSWNDKFEIIKGEEFFDHLWFLHFPPNRCRKPDGSYKFVFGPVVYHTCVLFERNDENLASSLPRQTNRREPSQVGLDERLTANQLRFFDELRGSVLQTLLEQMRKRVEHAFTNFNYEEEKVEYANQPHVKKKERMETMRVLDEMGKLFSNGWNFIEKPFVEAKVKAEEWGKFMKMPRLFISLGSSSIYGGAYAMTLFKKCFGRLSVDEGYCEYVGDPSKESMAGVFQNLVYGTGIIMYYFSDDSCVALTSKDGRRFYCNMDIRSCDGSHTQVIFKFLELIAMANLAVLCAVRIGVQQCLSVLRLKSYSGRRGVEVKLKPVNPVLYTGSYLTTIINNIAELFIFSAIITRIRRDGVPNYSDCRNFIRLCAEDAGYLVTIEGDGCPAQLQFLKHSPVFIDGVAHPVLNLGVILRMFGSCYGDLPGSKLIPIEARAFAWNRQLVQSLRHAGSYECLNKLRDYYVGGELNTKIELEIAKRQKRFERSVVGSATLLPDELVCARYGIFQWELEEVVEMLCSRDCGSVIETRATKLILQLDYGYKW